MKRITTKVLSMTSALLTAGALTASAQNADLEQLKSTVKSMEQTINELKQKISELERARAAAPPAPTPAPGVGPWSAMESNSPSIQALEKIAAGEQIAR